LQDKSPCQIYVRFGSEAAAVAAVAWCKAEPAIFADAKHGYQKYCVKFINNQKCTKANCPNRHSWCDTKDIRTFARTRCDGSEVTVSAAAPPPMSNTDQQRVQSMVAQNQMQSAFINQLLGTIKALRNQNASLKMQVNQLTMNQQQLQMQQMRHMQQVQQAQQQQLFGVRNMAMGMNAMMANTAMASQPPSPLTAQPEADLLEWDIDALPDIVDEAIKAESHRADCGSMHGSSSMYSNSDRSGSSTPVRSMYSSE